MFEVGLDQAPYEVDDLDAAACLDRLRECDLRARAADRGRLRLTLRWCQIKQVADPDEAATWGDHERGALADCDLPVGGAGTPLVAAYAAAPLGAALGVSTQSATSLMSDALDLSWRLPRLHAQVEDLTLALWKARRVAEATTALSVEAAAFVDDQLDRRAQGFGAITIDRIVALAIAKFHPELVEQATKAAQDHWDVTLEHPLPADMAGTSHLSATGDTLALTRFLELVSTVAIALGRLGDKDPLPVRRAKAIGIIADPDELADLLTRADHTPNPDQHDPDEATASPAPAATAGTTPAGSDADTQPGGEAGVGTDDETAAPAPPPAAPDATPTGSNAHPAPAAGTDPTPEPQDTDPEAAAPDTTRPGSTGTGSAGPGKPRPAGSGAPPRPSAGVIGGLLRKPAKVKLYVHLSAADLATLATSTGESVVIGEVERLGPATLTKIRDWLNTSGATITPVIDLNRTEARDLHDPPAWMRDLVILRDRHCVFPWCATDARSCDIDHIEPYHHGDDDGPHANRAPPGQTHPDGLAALCRKHHRTKTFAGWTYRRTPDGSYRWKDPYGNIYLVDKDGTHNLNDH